MIKNREIDMTSGPLFQKYLKVAIPIVLTNVMLSLFHSADVMVLGICGAGDNAMGAVGACTSLISLIICVFMGLSSASSILVAKSLGSKNAEKTQKIVGMSILLALISGIIIAIIGCISQGLF